MNVPLLTIEIRCEQDVVLTRQRAKQVAALLELSRQGQTAFATAVSEIARNAYRYAGGGRVEFIVADTSRGPSIISRTTDRGPGIANLRDILEGRYQSSTGMGLGIIGSQRLTDEFSINSSPGQGTTVTLAMRLPPGPRMTPQRLGTITRSLTERAPGSALEEVQNHNRELMSTLQALQARQAEVERLNAELAETNRGVLALYAELDDQAEALRRASAYKSRFLSDMTHELRTPLNAMISLSGLLLDRVDGELTPEQEKQVSLIHRSARTLGEMVDDLLDLAKIEAGKIELHPSEFSIAELLAALRGMFRPLFAGHHATLHVEEPQGPQYMCSDEGKLAQILRNLLSNALKFTEHGEVRVRSEAGPDGTILFIVSDTGIGIGAQDIERIFEDFTQVNGNVQRRMRGTGLGLPLTRKLARLLGGDVTVQSTPGQGSVFTLQLPLTCPIEDAEVDGSEFSSNGGRHA